MNWRRRSPLARLAQPDTDVLCPHCATPLRGLLREKLGERGLCTSCHGVVCRTEDGVVAVQDEDLGGDAAIVGELRAKLPPAVRARSDLNTTCLTCMHPLGAATGTRPGVVVKPGVISVCIYCGAQLRGLTEEEEAKARCEPMVHGIRQRMAERRQQRGDVA